MFVRFGPRKVEVPPPFLNTSEEAREAAKRLEIEEAAQEAEEAAEEEADKEEAEEEPAPKPAAPKRPTKKVARHAASHDVASRKATKSAFSIPIIALLGVIAGLCGPSFVASMQATILTLTDILCLPCP